MRTLLATIAATLALSLAPPALADGPLPASLRSAGVTQEQWDALQAEVRAVAARARVSERALAAVAERLALTARGGRVDVGEIVQALAARATQIAELEASLAALVRDEDPAVAALIADARAAIAAGDLDAGDATLGQARHMRSERNAQLQARLEAGRLEEAALAGAQGDVAMLRADYLRAAALFGEAAELAPENSQDRWRHTMSEGWAFDQATWSAPPESAATLLWQAVSAYDRALAMPRLENTWRWGTALETRARALDHLIRLGEAEAPARAVAAWEASIAVWTGSSELQSLAFAQVGLGDALCAMDAQSDGGDLSAIRRAAASYEASLAAEPRPEQMVISTPWHETNESLGDMLMRLDASGEPGALERAVVAYEDAGRFVRSVDPTVWAARQMKLGHALRRLGERGSVGHMNYALVAYGRALEARTLETDPVGWTDTLYHLALTAKDLRDWRRARSYALSALNGARQTGDAALVEQLNALIAQLPAR